MEFSIGMKTKRQNSVNDDYKEVTIIYLIKDGIHQKCPDTREECSNACPFFEYNIETNKIRLSCRPYTVLINLNKSNLTYIPN